MKKIHSVAALALLSALFLGGCALNPDSDVTQLTDTTNVSLSWWGNDTRHSYTLEGIDTFEDLNPEIRVSCKYGDWNGYEKRTQVYMESHTEADVMLINYAWLDTYSSDGEGFYDLYSLSDLIDLDCFTEEDLAFGEVNGHLNALPTAFNTEVVYYNKDIYDSYGLELPQTWEDFFTAAEAMREDGIYPIGMEKKHLMLMLIAYYEQTTGNTVFSSDGQLMLTSEDIEYMLEFYKRLVDEKVLMPLADFDRTQFQNGTLAGAMCWVSDAGNYCNSLDAEGVNIVIGDYPMQPGAVLSGRYMKPATMYAISSETEHPQEAAKLLDYLLNSSEMAVLQKTEKGVPVSSKAVETLQEEGLLTGRGYEAANKMMEERESLSIMLPVMENEEVLDAIKEGADEYLYGNMQRKTCAEMIYREIYEILENDQEM
jgi:oligogalacturonide transport system substrate-binding protein